MPDFDLDAAGRYGFTSVERAGTLFCFIPLTAEEAKLSEPEQTQAVEQRVFGDPTGA